MAVYDGLRQESFVPHFPKKIHAFLSSMHDIAEQIIIQKVIYYLYHFKQIQLSLLVCRSR